MSVEAETFSSGISVADYFESPPVQLPSYSSQLREKLVLALSALQGGNRSREVKISLPVGGGRNTVAFADAQSFLDYAAGMGVTEADFIQAITE